MIELTKLHVSLPKAVPQDGLLKEECKAAATLVEHTLTFHPCGDRFGNVVDFHAPPLNRTQDSFRVFARLNQPRY